MQNVVVTPKRPAEIKFYRSDKPHPSLRGCKSLIGFHDGLAVFPRDQKTYREIENVGLEKTLRVEIEELRHDDGGFGLASIVGNSWGAVLGPKEDVFDGSPFVLVDGQNFLGDVNNLDSKASPYDVLISALSRFRQPPQKVVFYVCKESSGWCSRKLEEIEAKANANPNFRIQLEYRKPKRIRTRDGFVDKTDVDLFLQPDLGTLSEATKGSKETLALFAGDSDYERACRQWLGLVPSILGDCCPAGRKLVVASSFSTRSFSCNLREVCNHRNARALRLEDYLPKKSTLAAS